ncbi:DUF3027 domain-containing protein [Streptomyces sp. DSM 44917]|uniref:DUF3027 domain-containing protein n=1 Tax=Streptomyces boetiae TaxID=3075541 RepID=A0ABU2L1L3_9ACTN|nr:DUF3027 domain-containing protein [Streptomyces sp. DSM 44917]MDT0305415.1 DUF3027 domain-containing protein [Streptomyces sp. DSM 44917]
MNAGSAGSDAAASTATAGTATATATAARSRTPDRLCADAVQLAREVAAEVAHPQPLGPYLGAVAEGDRVVTHFFASELPGYPGWRWGVTVARAARARYVTVDEVALTPGPEALLAPEWVPWSERLRPGDLGPGDLLPIEGDDPRLEPGFVADAPEREAGDRGEVADVVADPGMGRRRVLSWYGLSEAADRWDEAFGPETPMAAAAPANCVSCGFLLPMAGSLRQAFGVCANVYSPADGHVVSLRYGCGGHSEAAVSPPAPTPPSPVIDHMGADPL